MSLLVSVQYLSYIYHYVKEWRKNPECSFTCCLALVLPLRNLQGEIGGLAGRNVPRQQLQPGRINTTLTANTERDSGAVATIVEDYDLEREEEKEEEEDIANQISVKQGVLVQVSIHLPPKGIQDTKL